VSDLDGLESRQFTDFSGPNTLLDEEDIQAPECLAGKNIEFLPGQVRTRRGFAQAFNPTLQISSFFNWVQQKYNRLIYFHSGTTVMSRDLIAGGADKTVISGLTARGMVAVQAGYRVFMAFFSKDASTGFPTGAAQARVWDGTETGGVPNVEALYPRPFKSTEVSFTLTEPGAGEVSKGLHYFGILVYSYGGGITPPGPANSTNLSFSYLNAPSFTASGSKNLNLKLTVTGTWPAWAASVQVIMTPVSNPNRWFAVPGAVAALPRGGTADVNILFDVSDTTLTSSSDLDVVNAGYFSLLTQDASNNGPFSPHCLIGYNQRLVAMFQDLGPDGIASVTALAISNIYQPHWITRAKHILYLPEFRQGTTGFTLANILFICGPSWTYAFTDNTQEPVLWSQPRMVSATIGTPFTRGVLANPTRGWAWIADSSGLYYFEGGKFPEIPASYEQEGDWKSINFAAPPEALVIAEDTNRRLIMVMAPVGTGQLVANKILVWDYTTGKAPGKIKYCGMWDIMAGAYLLGHIGEVYSPTTGQKEIWISRASTNGKVLRQMHAPVDAATVDSAALYNDDSVGIDSSYTFGPMWGVSEGPDDHVAINIRARGQGTANLTAYSLGLSEPQTIVPTITLSTSPVQRFQRWMNKQSEALSIKIDNGATAGAFFVLSAIKVWRSKWMSSR
jgi:hypothetical protein